MQAVDQRDGLLAVDVDRRAERQPPFAVRGAAKREGEDVALGRGAGFTVPLALRGTRKGALTAAYAGGPSLTLRLVW